MPRVIPRPRGKYNARLGKGLTRLDPTRTLDLRRRFSNEIKRRFSRLMVETLKLLEQPVYNVFCATGEGGGVDPTCSPSGGIGKSFSSMPMAKATSKEAKAWRKENQTRYDTDKEFKAVVDAVTIYTQGGYEHIRAFAEKSVTGELPSMYKDSALQKWDDKPIVGSPLSKTKSYFKNQYLEMDMEEYKNNATYAEAGRLLQKAVENAPPSEVSLYRGLVGYNKEIAELQPGDSFHIVAPSSFSVDKQVGDEFAKGINKGQGRGKSWSKFGVLLEVEPGARALSVAALSPWDQKEVLTTGQFQVKSVEEGRDGVTRVKLTQTHSKPLVLNVATNEEIRWVFKQASPFPLELVVNLSSTQFNVYDIEIRDQIEHIQSLLDPDDVIELETQPHITVRYGLQGQEFEPVQSLYRNTTPIRCKLGGLSLFQTRDADVLKIDVESRALPALHSRLGVLPNTSTHPTYIPHLTVAYLRPGTGIKYVGESGLEGTELTFDELVFSNDDEKQTVLDNASPIDKRVMKFMKGFEARVRSAINDKPWWEVFVNDGFVKGAGRAYDDLKKPLTQPTDKQREHIASKRRFIKSTASGSKGTIKDLHNKVQEDLNRITGQLGDKLRTKLETAVAEGRSLRSAAKEILTEIEAEGLRRAENVAHYRTVEAHSEGQLAAYEELDVEDVGVMVEWTVGGNPCPSCEAMIGVVLRPEDAHGLIPRHLHCQCAFMPVGSDEGVDEDERIVDRSGIRRAVKASIQRERNKGSWKEQLDETDWDGADLEIDDRPLFNLSITPELRQFSEFLTNAFCPTGSGGGVDPTCSPHGLKSVGLKGPDRRILSDYQDNSHEINGWLREGIGGAPEAIQRQAIAFKKMFEKNAVVTDRELTLYRGLDRDDLPEGDFQDKAFVSTTTDKESAAFFGDIVMAIAIPRGTKVLPVLSGKEQEVILPQWKSFSRGIAQGSVDRMGHTSEVIGFTLNNSIYNVFCPTGEGGGVDPTCSPSSTTKGGEDLYSATRGKDKVWRVNGEPAPEHIQKLGIPPAWRDVEINPNPKGTVLAKGVDAKGRVQTKYSNSHTAKQAAAKFGRTRELIAKREQIYKELDRDAQSPEHKDHAECLKVVMQTGMRPGSDKDTKADHESFGATTLQGRHVVSNKDGSVTLRLVTGKNKGREVDFPVQDKSTASMLKARAKAAGKEGRLFKTTAGDLRDYSKSKDGGGFKTKDHRTALGTETAIRAIKGMSKPATMKEYKAQVKEVATRVSQTLGNTPSIALKSYIDPQVFSQWNKGLEK